MIYFLYIFIYITYYTLFLTSVSICKFIIIPNRSVSRKIPDEYPELYGWKKLKCWKVTLISDFFFISAVERRYCSVFPKHSHHFSSPLLCLRLAVYSNQAVVLWCNWIYTDILFCFVLGNVHPGMIWSGCLIMSSLDGFCFSEQNSQMPKTPQNL